MFITALIKHILANDAWTTFTKNINVYMVVNWFNKFDSTDDNINLLTEGGQKLRKLIDEEEGENKMSTKE